MNLKMLSITALTLALASGTVMAQTSGGTGGTSDPAPKVLEDPKTMEPFFTDSTMATLRSDEEVKAAFNALPAEQQATMKSECATTTSEKFKDFCAKLGSM